MSDLKHYGVKGMRWGVRRFQPYSKGSRRKGKELGKSRRSNSKESKGFNKALSKINNRKISSKEKARNLQDSMEKSLSKFEESSKDTNNSHKKKGLTDGQKKALKIAAGAAVVAALSVVAYKNRDNIKSLIDKGIDKVTKIDTSGKLTSSDVNMSVIKPGESVSTADFNKRVKESVSRLWSSKNYLTDEVMNREGITLPSGKQFNRLSKAAESTFSETTFATSTMDDFNRYVSGFREELKGDSLFHVTFKAKKDIKVPDTKTVMNTLEEVMKEGKYSYAKQAYVPQKVTKEKVVNTFNKLAGSSYTDDIGTRLMDKLRKKGFSAIVDEMDQGVIGDMPLLIIDPEAFTAKVANALSEADIRQAESLLKELTNRR